MAGLLEPFEAVFLGFGSHKARNIKLPGKDIAGVWLAWNFLYAVKNGGGINLSGARVLVLGAGDTAMDCARSALRLGAARVTLAYRRSEQNMRAGPKEAGMAREEGACFLFHHRPMEILGGDKVSGLRFATDKGERTEPCDAVILAIGFKPSPPLWLAGFDVKTDAAGRVGIDEAGRTSNPRIYAGGDNTPGPDLVVTAIAGGYAAAGAILEDFSLKGRIRRKVRAGLRLAEPHRSPRAGIVGDRA